jgi:hypothetical protein
MPLPSSGQITWDQIRIEFGGSTPINISDYYRGGARVPNTGANAAVPTSGQISASNFYGASASAAVSATPSSASGYEFRAEPAPATLLVTTSQTVTASGASTYTWTRISGSTSIVANSPSAATTNFGGTINKNTEHSAVFRVTGNVNGTADVNVTLTYATDL